MINKLKDCNKLELITKIFASLVILFILVENIIFSFNIREAYYINDMGFETFKYSSYKFGYFVIDFIFSFFILIETAIFPISVLFNKNKEKLPVLVYLILMLTFSLNNVVWLLTSNYYLTALDLFYLIADVSCVASAVIILMKAENTIAKVAAGLLQLPYIIVCYIDCMNSFNLYSIIFIAISPLFILYSFSMKNEKVKMKLKSNIIYVIICSVLGFTYMTTLFMVNSGIVS